MARNHRLAIDVDPTGSVVVKPLHTAEPGVLLSLHEARDLLTAALAEVNAALGD